MVISKEEIKEKIANIPPLPEQVKKTIDYLKQGDLQRAADAADEDIVLKQKISSIVNSAYFGFSKELKDTRQMFSAMGVEMAKGVVLSYMVHLLSPKEWKIFTKIDFEEFQSAFLANAKEALILEAGEATYKKYSDAIAIIPATICLIDDLLGDKEEQVNLLMETSGLNYGTILKRFTDMSLFELASVVAKEWNLNLSNIRAVKATECATCEDCEVECIVPATLHLEFFYLVSKPMFFSLNSLIDFNPQVIEIAKKNYERKINEKR
jgi:HD-like signal output (HDOD) protein